jgi:heme-degrading monooxygenase HmoA
MARNSARRRFLACIFSRIPENSDPGPLSRFYAMDYHVAQLNVAKMIAPLADPAMASFVARLEPINALADDSPGFVWRLQSEEGDATALRVFEDPDVLVNLSVWESLDALRNFVYRSEHRELLKARAQWFAGNEAPHLVLWWVAAGTLPSVEEAKEKLALLRSHGPSEHAFDFRNVFPPPA